MKCFESAATDPNQMIIFRENGLWRLLSYHSGDQSEANDIDTSDWQCSMPQPYFYEPKGGKEECQHKKVV